jgi:hypothetical protein
LGKSVGAGSTFRFKEGGYPVRSRRKIKVAVVIAALALVAVLLAGCSMDRWAKVEPGEYVVLRSGAATESAAEQAIQKLQVDRDDHLMVLTLVDGSEIVTSFVPRDKREWPAGCPSNLNSTRMEVLEIAEDPLTLGSTTFNHPILVRDCPPDPVRIVLREDGAIVGAGNACPNLEPCIYFAPVSTASLSLTPLPHSPKGYELYSWQAGEARRFTLITGTNRLKRYEEIVSTENIVTEAGWVKLSVQGTENLKAVLNRLRVGEEVTWIGRGWLEAAGVTAGNIQLPGRDVIEEIESHCRRLSVRLQIAD